MIWVFRFILAYKKKKAEAKIGFLSFSYMYFMRNQAEIDG